MESMDKEANANGRTYGFAPTPRCNKIRLLPVRVGAKLPRLAMRALQDADGNIAALGFDVVEREP